MDALRETLGVLRSHAGEADLKTGGARPELTVAKYQLRDWIESRLAGFDQTVDEKAFTVKINKTLSSMREPAGAPIDDPFDPVWWAVWVTSS